jgi:hypothetical protein
MALRVLAAEYGMILNHEIYKGISEGTHNTFRSVIR